MSAEQRSMEVFKFFCTDEFIESSPDAFKVYHKATVGFPTPTYIFRRQGEAIAAFDTWERLPSISAPTMIITGTSDQLVPFRNSELLQARIPGAELKLLPDKKHGFFIEAMDIVRISIDGFMQRRAVK
jgi:pimeloyl-ACP methyl ester carboxylesterase